MKQKIAILTNMMEFLPGYSLTGIIKDQITMLKRHGDDPHLFVNEQYHGEKFDEDVPVHKEIPFTHLIDYPSITELKKEHAMLVKTGTLYLEQKLQDYDMVWTHDFIFTGWFLPYGLMCEELAKKLPHLRWLHWVHSIPTGQRDYWDIQKYGPRARMVYPNRTDIVHAAEQFRGAPENVRVIHHIKDLRSFHDFDADTCEIIDRVPGIMQADIVQVLPASVDRLNAKRIREVISIFGHLNRRVKSVCLVIANQWATTRTHKETIDQYLSHAEACGLVPGVDIVFTSTFKKDWEVGVSKDVIRDLFTCSNVFVFPTREESFGLVVPEAALHGVLMVLNRSLTMQYEVAGPFSLFFDFGSHNQSHNNIAGDKYFEDIATIMLGKLRQNDALKAKTFARQRYNYDFLYQAEYEPVIAESRLW